jgi:hypothetical protein
VQFNPLLSITSDEVGMVVTTPSDVPQISSLQFSSTNYQFLTEFIEPLFKN